MQHGTATVEIKGTDAFRRVTLITTLVGATVSVIILACHPAECESNPDLRNSVIIIMSVQLGIFFLLLLHYIHCGCLLRKLGIYLGIFYFVLTGLMTWAQYIFFQGAGCGRTAVAYYWWSTINIGLFYVLIAYGLSLWGAYLCWAQEEEEALNEEALKHVHQKMIAEGQLNRETQN